MGSQQCEDPSVFQFIPDEGTGQLATRVCLFDRDPLPDQLLQVFRLQLGHGILSKQNEQAALGSLKKTLLQLATDRAGDNQQAEEDSYLRASLLEVRRREGEIITAALKKLD